MASEAPLAIRLRSAARIVAQALRLTTSLEVDGLGQFLAYPGPEGPEVGEQAEFPLRAGDQVFGALRVVHRGPLDDDQRATLEEAGNCVGLWLQSARRHDRDRELAEHLQAVLLPQRLPSEGPVLFDAAYRPATREHVVGGDWYDAFTLADGRIAFSIGDVAGHGLSAAVIMGEVRLAFRAVAIQATSPAEVLERANAIVNLRSEPTMVTATFGFLDPASLTFVYACAGHPPPALVSNDQAAILLPSGGLPLGIVDAIGATDWTFTLTPESLLVLYTDGLTEYDRDLDEGERRLLESARGTVTAMYWRPALRIVADIFRVRDNIDDAAVLALQNRTEWSSQLSVRMSAIPLSVPLLRIAVRTFCTKAGLSASDLADVELCAGEVVGNVALHAYRGQPGVFQVDLALDGDSLSVTVEDWGGWGRSPGREHSGRGLKVIRALMDRIDIETEYRHTKVSMRKTLAPRASL